VQLFVKIGWYTNGGIFNSVVTMDILGEIILNCRNYVRIMKVDNHDDVIRSVCQVI
jgi:hypothetical protein